MRTTASFETTDGVTLRGLLAVPEGDGPWPGVVLNHGFSATVGMGLVEWAEGLAAGGFVALAYDHRGLGASDGEPRGLVDWLTQARDLRDALTFLGSHPLVDAARLATWGSSFSAAQGAAVSTIDDRVKACVANVPYLAQSPSPGDGYEALVDALRGGSAPSEGVEVDVSQFLPQEESLAWFAARRTRDWRERVVLGAIPDPGVVLSRVQVPLLAILATEDRVAPVEVARAAVELVPRAEVVEIPGDHFVPYTGQPLERALAATLEFLRRVLPAT